MGRLPRAFHDLCDVSSHGSVALPLVARAHRYGRFHPELFDPLIYQGGTLSHPAFSTCTVAVNEWSWLYELRPVIRRSRRRRQGSLFRQGFRHECSFSKPSRIAEEEGIGPSSLSSSSLSKVARIFIFLLARRKSSGMSGSPVGILCQFKEENFCFSESTVMSSCRNCFLCYRRQNLIPHHTRQHFIYVVEQVFSLCLTKPAALRGLLMFTTKLRDT